MSPRPEALALVGKLVAGRFRVVQHLGSGGVGHVYLAERVFGESPTRVALKVLRPEHRQGNGLSRFRREALAGARVEHPNVLRIIETHVDDAEVPFFAMELLVGLDLADTLAYARTLSPGRAARIACAAAEGLAAAHAAGVVHRDVKPENIFLVHAPDGREVVRIVDFGFAALGPAAPEPSAISPPPASTGDEGVAPDSGARAVSSARVPLRGDAAGQSKFAIGTPEYMAPEQAAGFRGDGRSDVYSLGIVLYEMLTGRVPFSGPYATVAEAHARRAPPAMRAMHPGLAASPEIEAVVLQALAKDPESRPPMGAFHRALLGTREASGVYRRDDIVK